MKVGDKVTVTNLIDEESYSYEQFLGQTGNISQEDKYPDSDDPYIWRVNFGNDEWAWFASEELEVIE